MLISLNWLQKYFSEPLPPVANLSRQIIFHAFEVEAVKEIGGDTLLDLKILPDRAHDCLCHRGVAREIAAILNRPVKEPEPLLVLNEAPEAKINLRIEESKQCSRYLARVVTGVKVGESPAWLRQALEAIGQRSINNVVDIANYVMFDLGQPLHAFDDDQVQGDISVRLAEMGEKITTLDKQEINLDPSVLVIADEAGPLAIAGVKGGDRAAVSGETTKIILESANFDPVAVRRTATKLNLRTDASKRFENGITTAWASEAIERSSQLLQEIIGGEIKFGPVNDSNPKPPAKRTIALDRRQLGRLLGVKIGAAEVAGWLARLRCKVTTDGDQLKVVVPDDRLDLNLPADLIEEVGRLYGYENIAPILPAAVGAGEPNQKESLINTLKANLAAGGFTELISYTLTDQGDQKLANPLASDKGYLRRDLITNLQEKLTLNLGHQLFEKEPVKLFELGQVFPADREETHLAVTVGYSAKKYKQLGALEAAWDQIQQGLGINLTVTINQTDTGEWLELNLDDLVPKVKTNLNPDLNPFIYATSRYQAISPYPRIIRDVALFTPVGTEAAQVAKIITGQAGSLRVEGPILFDEFKKEDKISYAFRLAFQAPDRTLTDEEVNQIMAKVVGKLEENAGWKVR